MKKVNLFRVFCFIAIGGFLFIQTPTANATSQWARKFNMQCMGCHTAFPRLNAYGEQFMMNGYQVPGKRDGGVFKKTKLGNNLDVGALGDLFGARVNFTPVSYESRGLTVDGEKKAKVNVGKVGWIQFFTAGAITKDISFFNEFEIAGSDKTTHHGWFRMGFHNIFDTTAANFYVGKLSPADFTSHSNRLRIFPEYKSIADKIDNPAGDDTELVDITSGRYGLQYYGYTELFVWSLGVDNGDETKTDGLNSNDSLNYFGSIKAYLPSDTFDGSSFSLLYYTGTSTKNLATTTPATLENKQTRIQASTNIRMGDWDFIGTYHMAKFDNYTYNTTAVEQKFTGMTFIASTLIAQKYHFAAQYDAVNWDDDAIAKDQKRAAAHVSYLARENVNLIATFEKDILSSDQTKNNDKLYFTIRSMF